MLATVTTTLRHRVRLVHASTGVPITGLAARLLPHPYGWSMRTTPDMVVVAARTDVAAPPAPPQLAVRVTAGATADMLVLPPMPDQPPRTVLVDLTAEEIDVPVEPVPMTLTVVLTTPSSGAPSTGHIVTARATSGPNPKPTVDLPEVDPGIDPGVYRSAPVTWTAVFTPSDLLVDGSLLRTLAVDFSTTATRVHLVDTT
jgi:hypothetical protein